MKDSTEEILAKVQQKLKDQMHDFIGGVLYTNPVYLEAWFRCKVKSVLEQYYDRWLLNWQ